MNIALITDTHFGRNSDSRLFLKHFMKFFETVFFPYLKQHNIKKVIHLGDVFDRRKFINYEVLYHVRKYFLEALEKEGIELDILCGNHDTYFRNTSHVNSITELFGKYPNVKIYTDPTIAEYDGVKILLLPWVNDNNEEQTRKFIASPKTDIVFGHLELPDFEIHKGVFCNSGIFSRNDFVGFDMVLSGHFHHKSSKDNIHYLGCPYEMDFGDYNDPRGFYIFNTENRKLDFIQNHLRMFFKVRYDDKDKTYQDVMENIDFSLYKDAYVKVTVVNKENLFWFDRFLDALNQSGAADVSIIDYVDMGLQEKDLDHGSVESKDTITLINEHIDNLPFDNKNDLKQYIREIYLDSLNQFDGEIDNENHI